MGMYTTIVDVCDRASEWQIKTGLDDCERFSVGEDVSDRRFPNRFDPGHVHLQDDVYEGIGDGPDGCENRWVVISEGVIHGVFPKPDTDEIEEAYYKLRQGYTFVPPDPGLWTDNQWAHKARMDHQAKLREVEDRTATAGMTPEERVGYWAQRHIRAPLREEGFMRQILSVNTSLEQR